MRKIVFIAIVGFTGTETRDGRILVAPEGEVLHAPYPLPVYQQIKGKRETIGTVDQVAFCDRRIIAFGHLDVDGLSEDQLKGMAQGYYHFGLDVDHVVFQKISRRDLDYFGTSKRLLEWRVSALHFGPAFDAAWDLPPVVVEELNVTREDITHA